MKTKISTLQAYNIYKGRKYSTRKRERKLNLVKGISIFALGLIPAILLHEGTFAVITTIIAVAIFINDRKIFL